MTKIEALELELAARKMVEGTKLSWLAAVRHQPTKNSLAYDLEAYYIEHVELALGVVEGKPVWKGDALYCGSTRYTVVSTHGELHGMPIASWSWKPPKPKTVMVELLVEDAEAFYAAYGSMHIGYSRGRIARACRKALEELQ